VFIYSCQEENQNYLPVPPLTAQTEKQPGDYLQGGHMLIGQELENFGILHQGAHGLASHREIGYSEAKKLSNLAR
jgi:hypothetical protein